MFQLLLNLTGARTTHAFDVDSMCVIISIKGAAHPRTRSPALFRVEVGQPPASLASEPATASKLITTTIKLVAGTCRCCCTSAAHIRTACRMSSQRLMTAAVRTWP